VWFLALFRFRRKPRKLASGMNSFILVLCRRIKDNCHVIIREGFEYWLKARGKELSSYLAHCVGSQRFLWNEVLALQLARLNRGRKIASYYATAALLVKWKKRKYPFLAEVPFHLHTALCSFSCFWTRF